MLKFRLQSCAQCGTDFRVTHKKHFLCSFSCSAKWKNLRRTYVKKPDLKRFEKLMIPEPMSGCWIWLGGIDGNGYGHFLTNAGNKSYLTLAHRWAYEYFIGPISKGLQIDHLCRVRACVNPKHMETVTPGENTRRGIRATATHCLRGHEFTETNTAYYRPGARTCRECSRTNQRKNYKRKKEGLCNSASIR